MYRRNYSPKHHHSETQPNQPTSRQFPRMALTVEDLMDELQISRSKAYELVKKPDFPAFHIEKRILINREGLQRWMDEQCNHPLNDTNYSAA